MAARGARAAAPADGSAVLIASYSQTDREGQACIAAFLDTFQKLGWTDGRNVRIEYRWGAGDAERDKGRGGRVGPFSAGCDRGRDQSSLGRASPADQHDPDRLHPGRRPSRQRICRRLARPGGNITGFQAFEPAMGGKWLGVLKEAAPNLSRVAVLFGSDSSPTVAFLRAAEAVAPVAWGHGDGRRRPDGGEIERAVATFASQPDGGLIVTPNRYTLANRGSIIILAARHRLPAIYPFRYFATEGGLMSYGSDQIDQWRGAATYVDRILRGEKPGELPVQAPTKFELVVNLKTAKALGLNIPPAFPLRADEVIE